MYGGISFASELDDMMLEALYKVEHVIEEVVSLHESEEDKILTEAYEILMHSYKKLVEVTALYYGGLYLNTRISFEMILFETIKDFAQILKLLTLYCIKSYNNKHLSWSKKLKKSCYLIGLVIVLTVWLKECLKYFSMKQKNQSSYFNQQMRAVSRPRGPSLSRS